jgi:hypothetical protein
MFTADAPVSRPSSCLDAGEEHHMNRYVIAMVLILAPVLVLAQKTSSDFDKTANFASYHTYAMKDGTPATDPLMDQRIVSALKTQLAAKGFTPSPTPDVFVTYHVSVEKQKDISAYSMGGGPYGWGWGGGWGQTDVRVNEIPIGTLVIDMVDAKKNQMVWRGMGTKEIDPQAKAEKRDKNVNEAVEKMLKHYPPKEKS